MGHSTEQISFSTGRYGFFHEGSVESFTISVPLAVGPAFSDAVQVIQPGVAATDLFCEPGTSDFADQGVLDQYARCLLSTRKDGGTGSWTGTLAFRRGAGGGEVFVPPEFTDIDILDGTPAAGFFIVARLPMSFMRSTTGTPTIAETLRPQFTVTPGSTTTVGVSYALIMLPVIGQSPMTNPPGGRGQVAAPSIQGRR